MKDRTMEYIYNFYNALYEALDSALIGHEKVKKIVAASLLADSNSKLLFSGTPGIGKSTLAKFLATPFFSEKIMMSSDMLFSEIQEQLKERTGIQNLRIEELNRANGKVLNGFIELFSDKEITVLGQPYSFGDFYVVATQNNSEIAGIFTIPQAVYDRFDLNLDFGRLTEKEKRDLYFGGFQPKTEFEMNLSKLKKINAYVKCFTLNEESQDLLMRIFQIVNAIKVDEKPLFAGDTIRADMYAIKLAKLTAILNGHNYIQPADFVDFIKYLYMHRIDQNVALIGSPGVLSAFEKAEEDILDLRRKLDKSIFMRVFTRGK